MENSKSSRLFLLLVVCAAVFVWQTSESLPPVVASHFGISGAANSFIPRPIYVLLMRTFVLGLPALTTFITQKASGNSTTLINLPNKDYWLSPARRAESISFLYTGFLWFGVLIITFLCFTHWLVVLANMSKPAQLSEPWFFGGLGIFIVAVFIWLKVLRGHFIKRGLIHPL